MKKRYSLDPRRHGEIREAIRAGQLDAVSQRVIEVYRDATAPLDKVTATFLVQLRLSPCSCRFSPTSRLW